MAAQAIPRARRLVALGWDYLLIVGWLVLLAGLYLLGLRPLYGLIDAPLVVADLAITGVSVLPVWIYLVVTEAGTARATWGKRRAGLVVTAVGGGRPGPVRIMVRNAVKLLPWQLAHIAVLRLWTGQGDSVVVVPALVLCYGLVGATVALMLLRGDRAALHDLVAGTRVLGNPIDR
ncbi:RDD family protein [Nonomuraea sp. NPDC050404]|uniref:RDD family protein n=1 Tax=Nonomuraea sp. NPDC050404 TaxID=3155783 RepID=UPI0033CC8EFE